MILIQCKLIRTQTYALLTNVSQKGFKCNNIYIYIFLAIGIQNMPGHI